MSRHSCDNVYDANSTQKGKIQPVNNSSITIICVVVSELQTEIITNTRFLTTYHDEQQHKVQQRDDPVSVVPAPQRAQQADTLLVDQNLLQHAAKMEQS